MSKLIRLSDHFTYGKLLRFTLPSICMMVFTSIYGVVDGLFVSNFVGKTPLCRRKPGHALRDDPGRHGLYDRHRRHRPGVQAAGARASRTKPTAPSPCWYCSHCCWAQCCPPWASSPCPQCPVLLGASDAMIADCVLYGRIVTGFTFAFMLQNVFQSFFIAAGKAPPGPFRHRGRRHHQHGPGRTLHRRF